MQVITSKDNSFVKHIKKLKDKKYRDLNNQYIIEGIKLIREAIQENAKIMQIIICDNCKNSENIDKELMYEIAKYDCYTMPEKIFNTLTDVNTPQGIMAIVEKDVGIFEDTENSDVSGEINYNEDVIVALDDIQDPGNLGTILRTVDSVGLTQILVSKGTVDCYNPKVVRSTMGAIFRVKIIECEDLLKALKVLKKKNFKMMVTSLQGSKDLYGVNYNKKVIVIGNEANGVSEEIQNDADEKIKIPMLGKAESLNAAVATGVVLYEYVRQKLM